MQEATIGASLNERVASIMNAVRMVEAAASAAKTVGVGSTIGTGVHNVTREVFDALPSVGGVVEWRDGDSGRKYWSKSITKESTAYTDEEPTERAREVIVKRQESKWDKLEPQE